MADGVEFEAFAALLRRGSDVPAMVEALPNASTGPFPATFASLGPACSVVDDSRLSWSSSPPSISVTNSTPRTLLQTGKRPLALVMGNCVYHVAHRKAVTAMSTAPYERGAPQLHPGAIEFFAIGTAVTRYRDRGGALRPRMVLTLDG